MLRNILALMIIVAVPFAAGKKPKPKAELPSACLNYGGSYYHQGQVILSADGDPISLSSLCITNLRWKSDSYEHTPGHEAMTIFGTLENRSPATLYNVFLTFPLYNERDSIVREALTGLSASIPPQGQWEFKVYVETKGTFQLVQGPVLYTNAAGDHHQLLVGQWFPAEKISRHIPIHARIRFQRRMGRKTISQTPRDVIALSAYDPYPAHYPLGYRRVAHDDVGMWPLAPRTPEGLLPGAVVYWQKGAVCRLRGGGKK